MEQYISQAEVRRIIISDMLKKRNSIVPIIGEDTIVYKDVETGKKIPFQEFILREFQKKYPRVTVDDTSLTSMKERGYCDLSLLSQYYNEQGCFLDDFMDFVSKNASCIKLKDEVLDFLVTFNFPIIITTVCFDIIEQQLIAISLYGIVSTKRTVRCLQSVSIIISLKQVNKTYTIWILRNIQITLLLVTSVKTRNGLSGYKKN